MPDSTSSGTGSSPDRRSMMRRGAKVEVADLDDVEVALDAVAGPLVVVFDVDNTLVAQGAVGNLTAPLLFRPDQSR